MNVIPAPLQQYAKFVVGLAGAIVTSLLAVLPQPPHWLVIISSVVTALVVYVVPNSAADAPDPEPKHTA